MRRGGCRARIRRSDAKFQPLEPIATTSSRVSLECPGMKLLRSSHPVRLGVQGRDSGVRPIKDNKENRQPGSNDVMRACFWVLAFGLALLAGPALADNYPSR